MKELFIAVFVSAWSFGVGLFSYIRLKREYGKDED